MDIGAGAGAFSIPLASRSSRVTALEPAPAMLEVLSGSTLKDSSYNMRLAAWG